MKLDGYYALIDFGLCKEQSEGDKTSTDDEYSTGIVWHELLTGIRCSNLATLTHEKASQAFGVTSISGGALVVELFMKLIDPNNETRIIAKQALQHCFPKIEQTLDVRFPCRIETSTSSGSSSPGIRE